MTSDETHPSKRGWVFAFCSYLAALLTIFVLAYLRLIPVQIAVFPFYDTLGHFVLPGVAAYLGHRALDRRSVYILGHDLPLGPSWVALLVALEEGFQALSPNRTASFKDLAADLGGIVFWCWLGERLALRRAGRR